MAGRKRSGGKHGGRHGGGRGGGREGWAEGRPDQPTARRGRERNGPYWIYGDHAVAAAWDNPDRIINRLLYTEDATLPDPSVEDRPKPELVDRRGLEAVLPLDAVHQGIAAQAMPLSNPDILDLLPEPNSDGVVLVLDQISDPRNVGAILRSAAAFNALGVVMQDRHAPPEGGALAKAASGALETVPLIRINNLARCLEQLAEMGFWRHGLAMGEGNALSETSLTGKVALVLGAEGTGLRPLTQKNCDTLVHLPMAPAMESLNVSATAAIALFLTYQAMTGGSVTGN
ncbi:MAG: 23S rRNA (guanosine(2251)-2'-O)-methyltransferase RlmB [Rhodospirillaceae bacterium]|jgi:23S rRNA (guanosine2251-2'-O)-methyltransferase|nr:23S rRNA (guanosine(2251)-2'-O)-methyltransferase RlmB [Rhodospirillaceae bacterium]MBT4043191.1 23S rRNA (guanosine(2251)-2'-O)-methyltransferase RlmB [Rhodospirillaceae bacterium]MBT4686978.1 23S rRNA (guanosine(2251)-2'-O)-methyltransferase RlmB [Rhodospirillaceae bacterium]MBT5081776.1 23S rRNA (guanosine(2251)-2'-O)-methyltransferase RlmB [Rhodospirillaceae bacterium]MBT5525464.1 23S rRNA (guanosine(2251)-2'-O)-methyltransferase RlmB [Rhodospirillaceae bacterium]